MQNKIQDSARLIAIAVEKYPQDSKSLLVKNGVAISSNASKDELQVALTTALINSATFRNEFANFIVNKLPTFSSADGINYTFGSSIKDLLGTYPLNNYNSNVSQLDQSIATPTTTPSTATPPIKNEGGFFGGFNLNTGLGFVKDTLNSLAEIKSASANEALANTIATTRANEQTQPVATKSNTMLYVLLTVLGVGAIAGGIYYYKTKK